MRKLVVVAATHTYNRRDNSLTDKYHIPNSMTLLEFSTNKLLHSLTLIAEQAIQEKHIRNYCESINTFDEYGRSCFLLFLDQLFRALETNQLSLFIAFSIIYNRYLEQPKPPPSEFNYPPNDVIFIAAIVTIKYYKDTYNPVIPASHFAMLYQIKNPDLNLVDYLTQLEYRFLKLIEYKLYILTSEFKSQYQLILSTQEQTQPKISAATISFNHEQKSHKTPSRQNTVISDYENTLEQTLTLLKDDPDESSPIFQNQSTRLHNTPNVDNKQPSILDLLKDDSTDYDSMFDNMRLFSVNKQAVTPMDTCVDENDSTFEYINCIEQTDEHNLLDSPPSFWTIIINYLFQHAKKNPSNDGFFV